MVIVFIILSTMLPDTFFTLYNFQSMAYQIPGFGLLVLAMMVSIISGGIDLSIISIMSISGITAALIMKNYITNDSLNYNITLIIIIAILSAIIVSIICGLINGLLIAFVNVSPILATLGTMSLFMGIGIVITKAIGIVGFPESFLFIGIGDIFGIPVPLIIFLVILIILVLILNKTYFGLSLYLVGSNPVASKFSGINNTITIIKTYVLCGLLAGLSAIILIARANSAKSGYGEAYLLQSIIVVILGGINPAGGFGSISGVIMGLVIIQMIRSGFIIMGLSVFTRNIIFGCVLILVMIINYYVSIFNSKRKTGQLI